MLTFIEERRQRIRKAWEDGREEGRAEALAEITEALRRNPRIDAILRDYPEIRKALRDLGVELHA